MVIKKVISIIAAIVCVITSANIIVSAEEYPGTFPEKPREGCVYYVEMDVPGKIIYDDWRPEPVDPGFRIDRGIPEKAHRVRVVCGEGKGSPEKETKPVIDPCAVDNPALAGRGCIFFLEDKVVVANGDGNITTASGNIYDAEGNFVGTDVNFAIESGLMARKPD